MIPELSQRCTAQAESKASECITDQSESIRDAAFDAESHSDHRIANTTAQKHTSSHRIME